MGRHVVVEHDLIVVEDVSHPSLSPVRQIDVLLDVASVEVFANDGEASLTAYAFSGAPQIRATALHAPVTFHSSRVAELDSIWPLLHVSADSQRAANEHLDASLNATTLPWNEPEIG